MRPLKGQYRTWGKDPELFRNRTRHLLELLGRPDRGFKYIHITGTAGKGSVTNMLHEMLLAAGKQVGSYTSPYASVPIEKIKVSEKYIDPHVFARLTEKLKALLPQLEKSLYGLPSYFELYTALAFLYFQHEQCEWVVLEAGLGGRYDATNVIEKPLITALTNVDYDHMDVLGPTLEDIAWDKAGIIKPGSEFFTTERNPKLLKILHDTCQELDVPFHALVLPRTDFLTPNQVLAEAIAQHLGLSEGAIKHGLQAKLPCRFEKVVDQPITIVDGAHNPRKLRATMEQVRQLKYDKLHIVLGLSQDKHPEDMVPIVMPPAATIITTNLNKNRRIGVPPEQIAEVAKKYAKPSCLVEALPEPFEALAKAQERAGPNDCLLVTGSFYLAGELRKIWYPEEWVLEHRTSFAQPVTNAATKERSPQ